MSIGDVDSALVLVAPADGVNFERLTGRARPWWFAGAIRRKPARLRGGTVHLVHEAWRDRRGTELRRLVAKLPQTAGSRWGRAPPAGVRLSQQTLDADPVLRWSRGQRLDQTLLDLQLRSTAAPSRMPQAM
jgi:hypothetical protein